MGSESIETTLRNRRILFAGSVACMEHTRLPKCVMFGELVGGLLDDFRGFGIDPDKWTITAQDEGEGHRTAYSLPRQRSSYLPTSSNPVLTH